MSPYTQIATLVTAAMVLFTSTAPAGQAQPVLVGGFMPLLAVNAPLTVASPKLFSTNFTVVNASATNSQTTTISYVKPDGSVWPASPANTAVNLPPGANTILRQYADPLMPAGLGSGATTNPFIALGVVQIQARNGQTPSQGAYSQVATGANLFVPLVVRALPSASGLSNSQIAIQNVMTTPVPVSIGFIPGAGSPGSNYTRTGVVIPPRASLFYDLATEANLPDGFFGAAYISSAGTGSLAVVANLFAGPHQLQTFGGIVTGFTNPDDKPTYAVPLFMSRLTNGNSTSLSIQNVGSATLATGAIDVACKAALASEVPQTLTITNSVAIPANGSFFVNPVTDFSLPNNWYGSCTVDAGTIYDDVAVLIQQRRPGQSDDGAAYLATPFSTLNPIPAGPLQVVAVVPLVAKRLPNGFATAVTLMNLAAVTDANGDATTATVRLRYIPEGGGTPIEVGPISLGFGEITIRNHRLAGNAAGAEPALPDGWVGSLQVLSDSVIGGYVQLTNLNPLPGDNLMAHELLRSLLPTPP